jgi:hypothetical protein
MNWHEVVENCVVQVGIHPLRFDKELEREIPKGCERTKKEAPDRLRKTPAFEAKGRKRWLKLTNV